MKLKDLSNQKFGKLTVLNSYIRKNKKILWHCKCDCGKDIFVAACHLQSGHTKSCGCLIKEDSISNTRIYHIWEGIIQRCKNKNRKEYYKYGGFGRGVCKEWEDPKVFYKWAISNGYEDTLSIDRIDNSKGYSPDNCRWATRRQQNTNKIDNRIVLYKGKLKPLTLWCEELGLKEKRVRNRIDDGWSVDDAFEKPVGFRHKTHELTKAKHKRKTYFNKEVLV